MIRLAQIHSLKETWKDENTVTEALQRLKEAINHKHRNVVWLISSLSSMIARPIIS